MKVKEEEEKAPAPPELAQPTCAASGGWFGCMWGMTAATATAAEEEEPSATLDNDQRQELYNVIEYSDKDVIPQSINLLQDVMKMCMSACLTQGTFTLWPGGSDMISLMFDSLSSDLIQQPENMEFVLALGGLSVYDATLPNSVYPQIVCIKEQQPKAIDLKEQEEASNQLSKVTDTEDPFLLSKFEQNPLDKRADSTLTIRMWDMEIIYHWGYVQAIFKFF
ncbi:hypothetical protein DACRYDRAFT_19023 [Dacryopinax primogenitus]|uniref:Uncharacterized protein n=1 Tax=Dacryopinax primogenitus (strain DJM 731) TaxID=1858805 RepID=M5FPC7_DACPD|nr:uncharacterized protein DACRYDRAFT_19023 [Dacryopinax primogenitus]EJT96973.1 hypothetical protein DACRYDRAFT_19023 [Dacryopinax primogenitus]